MSWHIAHVLANVSGSYVQHSFVHLLDTTKQVRWLRAWFTWNDAVQDHQAVIQVVEHTLKHLRKLKLEKVHLRSDNAGIEK